MQTPPARDTVQIDKVALKAYVRLSDTWDLSSEEAASLIDMPVDTWAHAKKHEFLGDLSQEQRLRLSALMGIFRALECYFSETIARTWFTSINTGPLFGGQRPVNTAIDGGVPQMLAIRRYLDALLGGA